MDFSPFDFLAKLPELERIVNDIKAAKDVYDCPDEYEHEEKEQADYTLESCFEDLKQVVEDLEEEE